MLSKSVLWSGVDGFPFAPSLTGWSLLRTYLRGIPAPSAFSRKREPRLPPEISPEETAPFRQSLQESHRHPIPMILRMP
jgi:hypothetical protein